MDEHRRLAEALQLDALAADLVDQKVERQAGPRESAPAPDEAVGLVNIQGPDNSPGLIRQLDALAADLVDQKVERQAGPRESAPAPDEAVGLVNIQGPDNSPGLIR